jgi:hypothetical protein
MSVPPANNTTRNNAAMSNFPTNVESESTMQTDTESEMKFQTVSRVLHININGSLASFDSRGHTAGVWKPVEGKHPDVFGPHELSS